MAKDDNKHINIPNFDDENIEELPKAQDNYDIHNYDIPLYKKDEIKEIELGDADDFESEITNEEISELENKVNSIELPDKTSEEFVPNTPEYEQTELDLGYNYGISTFTNSDKFSKLENIKKSEESISENSNTVQSYDNQPELEFESKDLIEYKSKSNFKNFIYAGIAGVAILGGIVSYNLWNRNDSYEPEVSQIEEIISQENESENISRLVPEEPVVPLEENYVDSEVIQETAPQREIYTPEVQRTTPQREIYTPEVQRITPQREIQTTPTQESNLDLFETTTPVQDSNLNLFDTTTREQESNLNLFEQPEESSIVELVGETNNQNYLLGSLEQIALSDFRTLYNVEPKNQYTIENLITDTYRNAQGVSTITFNEEITNEQYNIKETLVYLDGQLVGNTPNVIGNELTYTAGINETTRIDVAAILESNDGEVGFVTYSREAQVQTIDNYINAQIEDENIILNPDRSITNLTINFLNEEGQEIPNIYQGRAGRNGEHPIIPTSIFGEGNYEIIGLDSKGNEIDRQTIEYKNQEETIDNFFN